MTEPSLTHRTSAGLGWLTAGSLLGKVFGLGSQLALGVLLIEEQFGAWAAILGFNVFAAAVRDLAIVELMIRGGREELKENFGPVVWLGGGASVLIASVMVVLGFAFADRFDNPDFATLNMIFAGIHIATFPVVLTRGLLGIDLRFKRVALMSTAGSIGRAAAGVAAALLGAGVLSFAFAYYAELVSALSVGARHLGLRELSFRPNFARWPVLLRDTPGLLVSRLGITLTNGGDLLLLGALSTATITGIYYMAVLLVNQFAAVLGQGLQAVLLPGFSRLRHDPPRLRAALTRALGAQGLIAGFGCGAILVCVDSAVRLVWVDKGAVAIPAQILAAGLAVRLTAGTAIPALRAEGRFITDGVLSIMQGVALPLGIYLALRADAGVNTITASGVALLAFVQLGLTAAPFIGSDRAAPFRAIGILLWRLSLPLSLAVLLAWAGNELLAADAVPGGRASHAILLIGKAVVYAALCWVLVLTVYRGAARETLAAMPPKLAAQARRLPGGSGLLA